eukprot:GILK01005406.1.p1 GENE.GILK01005406.1~~GILK01005406.1.p1  ORF type:complete len:1312 (-),score=250.82 GILK01005406.1:128-4063(-)
MASVVHYYRWPFLSADKQQALLDQIQPLGVTSIESEVCFNVSLNSPLSTEESDCLKWLLSETFEPQQFALESSFSANEGSATWVLELGPRLNFSTAWSTNAVAICQACNLQQVDRLERSRRYRFHLTQSLTETQKEALAAILHDRMTECVYATPLTTFETGIEPDPVCYVPVLEDGRAALERINSELGLSFDDHDLEFYTKLFRDEIRRNPTNVECFDLAQSNSEHCRHWFFRGRLVVDGQEAPFSLLKMVKQTLDAVSSNTNSLVAFRDNSSAIKGYPISTVLPATLERPSAFQRTERTFDICFTSETHNFPCAVAPFPGAETGSGGRIRDVQATGRGAQVIAGTAGYCVGNLYIPNHPIGGEDPSFEYSSNLASPLQILVDASNGASDYGNKFGEPLVLGYTRSFGLRLPNGERREWVKPIMFTGGVGQLDHTHIEKETPSPGMLIVKIGGPAYRIGMGGGAASSRVQNEGNADLDFNAVQRGDAEMENKMNRVIRACVELGSSNPITSIHDQGAGGSGNVLKEIVAPVGARLEIRDFHVGDKTLSVLEIWGGEYQEQNALLIRPQHKDLFDAIASREKAPVAYVGVVEATGKVVLNDRNGQITPVDLELEKVLGDLPPKVFTLDRLERVTSPLTVPALSLEEALNLVLKLPAVCSKRFLTNKVDRSVTGLVAQQQCVGPLHTPLSGVAVIAQSHFVTTGCAFSIGEQPVKTLLDPHRMARLTVGEALTNLVFAPTSGLQDVKAEGNWMWAAKMAGEGALLYDACVTLRDTLIQLGVSIDGGKDSLSMAAQAGQEMVKAPGSLVISAYVTCPDVTKVVTPDLKRGGSVLLFVDLTGIQDANHAEVVNPPLGASALAQALGTLGDRCPDVHDVSLVKAAFGVTQTAVMNGQLLAGHDRSDGGLITTVLEMAFAGNRGVMIDMTHPSTDVMAVMFNEALGLVLEVDPQQVSAVTELFSSQNVPCVTIGSTVEGFDVTVKLNGHELLKGDVRTLRDVWESTSFELEKMQCNVHCVKQEQEGLRHRTTPPFHLSFTPEPTPDSLMNCSNKPKLAVIREEGSNGDREMVSAFYMSGFDVWDVTMTDLTSGKITLESFRGIVFVGGFSYGDVLDSAKGWAGVIRCNPRIWDMFETFYKRSDTFSLGVCNGCQLMALLGWVPFKSNKDDNLHPRFVHNASGRFESRFSTVKILESPSILLQGMAGSTLGIWVAHGEGRALFPRAEQLVQVEEQHLAPIRYVDDANNITQQYPFNPNGSPQGIAALTSPDGRHLAIMPHPERSTLKWQWPYMPAEMRDSLAASPWLQMFQNARKWCQ